MMINPYYQKWWFVNLKRTKKWWPVGLLGHTETWDFFRVKREVHPLQAKDFGTF